MSIQTTLARGAARAANTDWSIHSAGCSSCGRGGRRSAPCITGTELRDAAREANRALAAERLTDKAPNPAQLTLR